ncbi:MAG: alpha/beta hydrolase [Paludibacteraceae bacterium]|nr:alpha/beta hydrolase [Paludibacteraceae bacterium]
MKKVLLSTLLFSTIIFGIFAQENPSEQIKKVKFPENYQSKLDVVYTRVNNWEGRMDIYYNPTSVSPTPAVIHIHGGGWNHGTKESQTGFGSWFKSGFAVINVEYRLVQVAPAPAAIEDVRCALTYLKTHAKELNVNPDKIVVDGSSAGAHLALMVGLLENDRKFDTNCPSNIDMRVAAIVSNYAPTDFSGSNIDAKKWKSLANWLGDKVDSQSFRDAVSPLTYVNKTSSPVFIVHGNADPIVPYQQSVALHEKLDQCGVYNVFITVDGGGHGGFDKEKKTEINNALIEFLSKTVFQK